MDLCGQSQVISVCSSYGPVFLSCMAHISLDFLIQTEEFVLPES